MKRSLVSLCWAPGALLGIGCADDFPPVRNFGPFCRFAGGDIANAPLLMGPSGVIGWFHGREFVVREVERGSQADGVLRPGDVVMRANGHGLGAEPSVAELAKRFAKDKESAPTSRVSSKPSGADRPEER